jgi:hypothetical protein
MSFSTTIDDVVSAIQTGDAARISRYFDDVVQIGIDGKNHVCSRTQAEMIMRNFFTTRVIKGFTVEQKGGGNDSEFFIGSLSTESNAFRTTVYLRTRGDRKLIQELRFDPISR